MWLDKLGSSAQLGIEVVIKQSVFGGNYALINNDLEPNPCWWISVFFKKFVTGKNININSSENIRAYANCVSSYEKKTTIVIYGMNIKSEPIKFRIKGLKKESKLSCFIFTSDDLLSQ